ncbi:hypothetical protein GRI62_05635 [Erythrobacter arachoides]|uniref:ATPase n=1 Tax=Aurantiacibacter arachoides TaxID=1850444 RepID=A0A845A2A7_9SPHN|nr:hypothetical protein [Aurantiacibacter arachoides]MXO93087.1 hypothetical protein [Aurantiacibacter arachoides]GGD52124.1 hypothetical protein GCM10011411_09980 [Aurantiacibacter arachoides]
MADTEADHTTVRHENDGTPAYDEAFEPEAEEAEFWTEEESEPRARPRFTWAVPLFAGLIVLAWTGFFFWTYRAPILAGAPAQQWIDWIGEWSLPVILVIGLWLLAMRNSRREANRFTDAARALSEESALLESRLAIVNRELAISRDFIAAQSRDLETLGRLANERLSTNADRLQTLIRDNSAQVEQIGSVSDTALANMTSLRDHLPVVANAARDMTNQIGNAGNVAQEQVEALVTGFDRLNQFGVASERHVERIGERVGATLELFDTQVSALGEATQERFDKLRRVSEGFRADLALSQDEAIAAIRTRASAVAQELRGHDLAQRAAEEEAIAAMRERLGALQEDGERLLAALGEGHGEAVGRWSESIAALESRMQGAIATISEADEVAMTSAAERLGALDARLVAIDAAMHARQDAQVDHAAGMVERTDNLAARMAELDAEMRRMAAESRGASEGLGDAAQGLADRVEQSRAVLENSGELIARLTSDSVRLLEIIRSGSAHSQGALADSIGEAEKRLARFGNETGRLHALIGDAALRSEALSGHVENARDMGTASLDTLTALEQRMTALAAESERLAERTGSELRVALEHLAGEAGGALENLRENQREVIDEIADRIAEDSRTRIAEAIRHNAIEAISELEDAVARATESGEATTAALRSQLGEVETLAGNLEARIDYARERAEERIDSEFTRRMALITEALNSSAIDIAKAFDNEVSDTQWSNYLRGDRGIFTRRAVRLLDKHESRAVAGVYDEDSEFRETVNRYIHDFEAMLREVLSTRDGNAIAVTLLSSDVGKLYVALAQSIDRLRG